MPDNAEDHVAFEFHGLVSDLQRGDVERFEAEQKKQSEQRAALRRVTVQGMNAGELLKKIDGDPGDAGRNIQNDLDRIDREAKEAVAASKNKQAPLPEGSFPPPPDNE